MYVTHDQVEAMTMGTRVAVMQRGVLEQVGPPQEVYDKPASLFVAQFLGTPPMNVFPAGHARAQRRCSSACGPSTSRSTGRARCRRGCCSSRPWATSG